MSARRYSGVVAAALAGVLGVLSIGSTAEPPKNAGPGPQEWDGTVEKAITFLKSTQSDDGSWNREQSPGVTGIALTGMLQTGKVTPQDPVAERALKYIESLVNTKAGHIAGKDPRVQLQNYVTCVNVMA